VNPKTNTTLLRPDASYILVGGTGGLGRSVAKWMSSKGAKHIVLVSRHATINDKVQALINDLAPLGVQVIVKACDVSNQKSVEALVNEEMKDLPPVRGVIHGAMVLRVSSLSHIPSLSSLALTTDHPRIFSLKACLSKTLHP
jgi:NAD(P)-dependent dehydrogenase (short-subunit alcohol dehydrogenase family)